MRRLLGGVVARDELDAAGDVDVALTGDDVVGGGADGVEARRAVARDGDPVRLLAELLAQQDGDAGDVVRLQTLGQAAAGDDLLDARRVHPGVALEQLIDDERQSLIRPQPGERALEGAPDGCGRHRR